MICSPIRWVLCALAIVAATSLASTSAVAQDAPGKAIQAHLDAGEFGPARRAAAHLGAAGRDVWLGRIARAQAMAGARDGALSSLSDIGDDRVRTGAIGAMNGEMVGNRWGGGGATLADFDTLIDLVTTTIAPQSWEEVGGPGAIEPFPGGVFVDGDGLLKKIALDASTAGDLMRKRSLASASSGNLDARRESPLRMVSLTRLEKQAQLLAATGRDPSEVMRNLAGIYKIKYVFVYPETGDVVIAGPAGDWAKSGEDRIVHAKSGKPVLQLDDLVVMLRTAQKKDATFGCSITPTRESLERTQAFSKKYATKKVRPSGRNVWLDELRGAVGRQNIEVFGIDARTRAARVLVEADYRMKLIGIGLEKGTLGVTSYFDALRPDKDGKLPAMSVLRWWFTLNYDAIRTTKARNAYQLVGSGVKVLSENELLTKRGERVHTGKSDEPTREFAHSFTKHFEALAANYPIYAELRNIFDLALVANIIRAEDLAGQVGWHMTYFGDADDSFRVTYGEAPSKVMTVGNIKVIDRRQFVGLVSGGVKVNTTSLVNAIKQDEYGLMKSDRSGSRPPKLPRTAWWWD